MAQQIVPRAARNPAVEPTPRGLLGANRLANRMWNEMEGLFARETMWPFQQLFSKNLSGAGLQSPNLKICDEEEALMISAETPGYAADEIDLRVDAQHFTLEASHAAQIREGQTRSYESSGLYESIGLPPGIDTDKVEATYANGVLTVRLPKAASARSKKIAIKAV